MRKLLIRLFYVWPATAAQWCAVQSGRASIAMQRRIVEKRRIEAMEQWKADNRTGLNRPWPYIDRLQCDKLEARDK